MEGSFASKAMTCFEVEKIVGISDDGTYQVQWAPAWVSKFHLVGCEHLIQEFLEQQVEKTYELEHSTVSLKPTEPSSDLSFDHARNERAELETNSTVSQETTEVSQFDGKERNACVGMLSYSQRYSEPLNCYDVKPDIYTDMDQDATEQSLSSMEDLTHQFESPEKPILNTDLVKLEPNEGIEDEMSASNDFNTTYEPGGTPDYMSVINPSILNERTNLQPVDFASPSLHVEKYEANLQSFPDEMYPKMRDVDSGRESDPSSKTTTCDNCEKSFSCKSKLELHHGIHDGSSPYPCPPCSYSSAQNSTLTSHMTTHLSKKPFSCDVCQKTFARSKSLKLHKTTHNKEKPHSCSTCSKTFAQKSDLKRHFLTHTKEKPHKCEHCGKCFALKRNLKQHLRLHTGEKPYSCQSCGKTFADQSNLSKHRRRCTCTSTNGKRTPEV